MNMRLVLFIISLFIASYVFSQADKLNWDNQIYLGNKVAFGQNRWKYSAEIQTRLRNNFRSLDNWYVEFAANHLVSESFEFVPDFRFTVKPARLEVRPGIGILYKKILGRVQLVNQIKWQTDFPDKGDITHAFREVVFLNYVPNGKVVISVLGGFIYKMTPQVDYFQYIRIGPGVSYRFDNKHTLNLSYFVGIENKADNNNVLWAGIPVIQLLINISKEYAYTPAYYFEF
jgi:hypothetical protein